MTSDKRGFAAVVIRNGYVVLEVERGNSAKTDSRRVASVSKAVCATVLAIASEQSRQGSGKRRMTFDDPAFDFIPWAHPLSDPRKAKITIRQMLNHTSGICPEGTGAPNDCNLDAYTMATGATGQFSVDSYNSGSPRGTFHLRGGMVTQYYGAFYTFNSSGVLQTGFARDFHYDKRGLIPPYYPMTNRFNADRPIARTLSWKEI